MTTMHSSTLHSPSGRGVSHISLSDPFHWVSAGMHDFRRAPSVGRAYGLMVAVMGWIVLALGNHPYYIAAALSGFLLLGPILGAGLIESSRMLAKGSTPTFDSSLRDLGRCRSALETFAWMLVAIAVAWLAISTFVLNAMLGPIAPNVEQTLWDNSLRLMSSGQWLAWLAIGGGLAVISFAISVVAVPLILDQDVSAREAMRGSLRAVARHPLVCAEWAIIIAALTAVGIATALIGLIVIYPLLGHASWHAYRALTDRNR